MGNEVSKRYAQRGVSASKEDVHNAIKNIDKGLFPQAFCKIVPDHLTNDSDYCLIMHAHNPSIHFFYLPGSFSEVVC